MTDNKDKVRLIYQSALKGTASSAGPSWWSITTTSGKRRKLTEEHRELVQAGVKENFDAAKRGSFFHALVHMDATDGLPGDVVLDAGDVQEREWTEAVRIFTWFRANYPKEFWGEIMASELVLPVNDEHELKILNFFPHKLVTGGLDRLVMLSQADVERLEKRFEMTLRGPGLYILDWKSSGQRWNQDKIIRNVEGMQSLTYQTLWNLAGGEQVKGMIFVVVTGHKELGPSSVQCFFSPWRETYPKIVRHGLQVAYDRYVEGKCDPYGCFTTYEICPFFLNGMCGRDC